MPSPTTRTALRRRKAAQFAKDRAAVTEGQAANRESPPADPQPAAAPADPPAAEPGLDLAPVAVAAASAATLNAAPTPKESVAPKGRKR